MIQGQLNDLQSRVQSEGLSEQQHQDEALERLRLEREKIETEREMKERQEYQLSEGERIRIPEAENERNELEKAARMGNVAQERWSSRNPFRNPTSASRKKNSHTLPSFSLNAFPSFPIPNPPDVAHIHHNSVSGVPASLPDQQINIPGLSSSLTFLPSVYSGGSHDLVIPVYSTPSFLSTMGGHKVYMNSTISTNSRNTTTSTISNSNNDNSVNIGA
ncbi:hypothetical protein C0991_002091 [Blastosporella zonata]|nr:hypothetical protein C0991_002091 [Blastosporella zonata]